MIRIDVALYLNGILFHPEAVSVSAAAGQQLSFTASVPAVPEWELLPPRSHAAVFFLDPVSLTWRLLVEGEYIGYTSGRSAGGQRDRQLQFRSLFGYWDTSSVVNILGAVMSDGASASPTSATTQALYAAVVNGQTVSADTVTATDRPLEPLAQLFTNATQAGRLHQAFISLATAMTKQMPVEAFYASARRVLDKLVVLDDPTINRLIAYQLVRDQLVHGAMQHSFHDQMPVSEILGYLESLCMYHHVPILAPPLRRFKGDELGTHDSINEVVFMPHLFNTVPPACNVIFDDQIIASNGGLNFMARPTRVVTELQLPLNSPVPRWYMANDHKHVYTVGEQTSRVNESLMVGAYHVTHGVLSAEELEVGVIAARAQLSFETIFQTAPSTAAPAAALLGQTAAYELALGQTESDWSDEQTSKYAAWSARHHYSVIRGNSTVRSYSCVFLPYVTVGFTCLIEDGNTPYHGMVQSVTHTLRAGAPPVTEITVSHVRPAYALAQSSRTPPLPTWLNVHFTPARINDAYFVLFGANLPDGSAAIQSSSAAIRADQAVTAVLDQVVQRESNPNQVDMDRLLGDVINIPQYNGVTTAGGATMAGSGRVAAMLRAQPDVPLAFLQYQYRPGVKLSDYCRYHKLPVEDLAGSDFVLPETLVRASPGQGGHPMFGTPWDISSAPPKDVKDDIAINGRVMGRWQLEPNPTGESLFAQLVATARSVASGNASASNRFVSRDRQAATELIASAMARQITNDTRDTQPFNVAPSSPGAGPEI